MGERVGAGVDVADPADGEMTEDRRNTVPEGRPTSWLEFRTPYRGTEDTPASLTPDLLQFAERLPVRLVWATDESFNL